MDYLIIIPHEDSGVLQTTTADPLSNFALFSEVVIRSTIRAGTFHLDQVIPNAVISECLECLVNIMEHSLSNPGRFLTLDSSSGNNHSIVSLIFTLGLFGTNQQKSLSNCRNQSVTILAIQCLIELCTNRPMDLRAGFLGTIPLVSKGNQSRG